MKITLDCILPSLQNAWGRDPDAIILLVAVPIATILGVIAFLIARNVRKEILDSTSLPDPNTGRHSDSIQRLRSLEQGMESRTGAGFHQKAIKNFKFYLNAGIVLFGLSAGLIVASAPSVLG